MAHAICSPLFSAFSDLDHVFTSKLLWQLLLTWVTSPLSLNIVLMMMVFRFRVKNSHGTPGTDRQGDGRSITRNTVSYGSHIIRYLPLICSDVPPFWLRPGCCLLTCFHIIEELTTNKRRRYGVTWRLRCVYNSNLIFLLLHLAYFIDNWYTCHLCVCCIKSELCKRLTNVLDQHLPSTDSLWLWSRPGNL